MLASPILAVGVLELFHPKANACKSPPSGQARVPHKNEAVSWCLAPRDGVRWNGVTLIPDLVMVSQTREPTIHLFLFTGQEVEV